MSEDTDDFAPRKGHKEENFPVASFIIKPRHRAAIMAFYRFARIADDVADHPSLSSEDPVDPARADARHPGRRGR